MESIRLYVNGVFGGLRETPELAEQKDELIADLHAKVADLVEEGNSEDAAFGIAVASLGDFSELVAEFRAAQSEEDSRAAAEEAVRAAEAARIPVPTYTVFSNKFNLHLTVAVGAVTIGLLFIASVFSYGFLGGRGIVASIGITVVFLTFIWVLRAAYRAYKDPLAVATFEFDREAETAKFMQKVWLAVVISVCANLLLTVANSSQAELWAWSPAFVVYCFGPGAVRVKAWMLDRGYFVIPEGTQEASASAESSCADAVASHPNAEGVAAPSA